MVTHTAIASKKASLEEGFQVGGIEIDHDKH